MPPEGNGSGADDVTPNATFSDLSHAALEPFIVDGKLDGDKMLNSYVSAQDMVSRSVRIPGKDAGEEDQQKFNERMQEIGFYRVPAESDMMPLFDQLGRPEKADGYTFDIPEGVEEGDIDQSQNAFFADLAHSAGLTQQQAAHMYKGFMEASVNDHKATVDALNREWETVHKKWGTAVNDKMAAGDQFLTAMEQVVPGIGAYFKEQGLDKDPYVRQIMAEMAAYVNDTPIGDRDLTGGRMTAAEAAERISEIQNNPKHPWHNPQDPGHQAALDEVDRLYAIRHGVL